MTLVILAAGMGSRFGGMKQITPVGPSGEFIIDYSCYDAIKAGFDKIVLDTNLTNLRAQHVYESLGFRKLRINYDSWTDQLGNKQSAVDYELTEDNFVDFRK